jgi:hypothetical protein
MANYLIIGGDGKEYGPASDADVRLWIAEGRVNAHSQAKAENDTEFRPLSTFPEFADALAPKAPPTLGGSIPPASARPDQFVGEREEALRQVKGPAIGLIITAIMGLLLVTLGFAINIAALAGIQLIPQHELPDPQLQKLMNSIGGSVGLVQDVIGAAIGVVVLMGARKMLKLEAYQFAMTAAIAAMVPCVSPCCFLGLPFGIWALVVLNKPEIKRFFSSDK